MDVTVAGVAEDHDRNSTSRRRVSHCADIVAHPLDRYTGVFDDLQRPSFLG